MKIESVGTASTEGETSSEVRLRDFLKVRLENASLLTDGELVDAVNESARDIGKPEIFEEGDKRPKVFYRALPPDSKIQEILGSEEFITRPFSYCLPGTQKDLPLAYGGKEPILIRIVDTTHEWEDTGPYWGFGNNWSEAMNFDPVVLKKVHEEGFEVFQICIVKLAQTQKLKAPSGRLPML